MRVLTPPLPEGVVVNVDLAAGVATVAFDSEAAVGSRLVTQVAPVSTILPVSELPPSPTVVPFSHDLLSSLLAIMRLDSGVGKSKGEGKGGKDGKGDTAAASALQAVESCVVWRCQLKRQALQTLLLLLQHPPFAVAALTTHASLLADLLGTALQPSSFPQFVAPRWLEYVLKLTMRASCYLAFRLTFTIFSPGADICSRHGVGTFDLLQCSLMFLPACGVPLGTARRSCVSSC